MLDERRGRLTRDGIRIYETVDFAGMRHAGEVAAAILDDIAPHVFPGQTTGEIDRIITGGLKFALTADPASPINLPDGSSMDNIIHPSWFVLLGPDGDVTSLYRPSDAMNMEVLLEDVRRLVKTLPTK